MLEDGTGFVIVPVSPPERECCFSDPKVPWRTGASLSDDSEWGVGEDTGSVVGARTGKP